MIETAADGDDEREEELGTLSAIYPELTINSQDPYSASLDLEVSPAKPLLVRFVPDRNHVGNGDSYAHAAVRGAAAHIEHDVALSHLPPLHIEITLPVGYPAKEPPVIHLQASDDWLPTGKITHLEEEAAKLWEEFGQCQVLFSYIDFLQQAAETGFDLDQSSDGCLKLGTSREKALIEFDAATALAKFRTGTYDCEICVEPKKGAVCYRMEQCQHVFCLQCLQDFYNNAINEGDVVNIRCLSPNCGKEDHNPEAKKKKSDSTLHPRELLAMGIDESKVRRYLELKRKKRLESDKSTVYCPRTWCQGPARSPKYPPIPKDLSDYIELPDENDGTQSNSEIAEPAKIPANPSDRLAVCEKCALAFCRVCYRGWHGSFQRCFPRDPNELSAEEKASYEYIRLNTSPCPTCSSPTQKTMGCNHMKCFQCNTHFCYLCGAWLDGDNPYMHFNKPGTECYQRLWELEGGDEGQAPEDGNGFAGGRGYERMAIEVAREADAREAAEAAEAAEAQAHVAVQAQVQVELDDDDDEVHFVPLAAQADVPNEALEHRMQRVNLHEGPRRRINQGADPARQPRDDARGGRRGGAAHPQRAPAGAGAARDQRRQGAANGPPADDQAQRLQRFLALAARDQEDEWDSDELGNEEDFIIR